MSPAVLDRVGARCAHHARGCIGFLKPVAQAAIAPGRLRTRRPGEELSAVVLVCSRCDQAHGTTTPEELELGAVRAARRRDKAEQRGDLASTAAYAAEVRRLTELAVELRQAEASR